MKPIYVGYFTEGTPYEDEARQCAESLERFGLDYDFLQVENSGDWCRNCAKKPSIIHSMMLRHDGRPVVYLDVDARMRQHPILLESFAPDVDVAYHKKDGQELLSGTLYFGPTAHARNLVMAWSEMCLKHPDVWDQKHLQGILDNTNAYRTAELPASYVSIFDAQMSDDPVIEHMQASRRLREVVSR